MGMFDYVNFKMKCPECGTEVASFQTKDLSCNHCGVWIEFFRDCKTPEPRLEAATPEQAFALGFGVSTTIARKK